MGGVKIVAVLGSLRPNGNTARAAGALLARLVAG